MPEPRYIRSAATKYIRFVARSELHEGKPVYDIENKRHNEPLGLICWYPRWQQWICSFISGTIWSADCLEDVRAFMAKLSAGEKAGEGSST